MRMARPTSIIGMTRIDSDLRCQLCDAAVSEAKKWRTWMSFSMILFSIMLYQKFFKFADNMAKVILRS